MSTAAALRSTSEQQRPRARKTASRKIFAKRGSASRRRAAYRFVASRDFAYAYGKARQDRQSLQTDPVGYEDDLNLYAYVRNDPVSNRDPTGTRCAAVNADSVYCLRRDIYQTFDRRVSGSTRFFGAAARTVEYLANNDIPIFGNVLSDQAEAFLRDVSANVYSLNAGVFAQIQRGELSGANLDARLVHMEQTRVQEMLDALPSDARAAIVESINSAFNNGALRWAASNSFSGSDARYNRVLSGVIRDLGRPIDFANQGDREAIGNALIEDLRRSGDCTRTGSRIPTC